MTHYMYTVDHANWTWTMLIFRYLYRLWSWELIEVSDVTDNDYYMSTSSYNTDKERDKLEQQREEQRLVREADREVERDAARKRIGEREKKWNILRRAEQRRHDMFNERSTAFTSSLAVGVLREMNESGYISDNILAPYSSPNKMETDNRYIHNKLQL